MFNQLSRSFHLSARKICPNYSSHPFWLLLSKSVGWLFSRYAWIWRMSQQLGWSVWRPTGQARQRDEAAISTSKKKRWRRVLPRHVFFTPVRAIGSFRPKPDQRESDCLLHRRVGSIYTIYAQRPVRKEWWLCHETRPFAQIRLCRVHEKRVAQIIRTRLARGPYFRSVFRFGKTAQCQLPQ